MNIWQFCVSLVAFYLLGSVPFGLIYSLIFGVDIRKVGSGNIGATNVSRQFGFFKGFLPVFVLDFLKGALPVIVIKSLGVNFIDIDLAMIIAGFVAALGHIFPIYLGFKGGKGVATFAGMYFFIAPLESLLALIAFLIVLFLSRLIYFFLNKEYRSGENPFTLFFSGLQKSVWISSISAAIVFPIAIFISEPFRMYLLVLSIITTFVVIFSHRKNIKEAIKRK
ncbi:MAG: glycerol-3-phosphate acyltransferase [Brevinematia bacterium]